jgi:hypothetical protein
MKRHGPPSRGGPGADRDWSGGEQRSYARSGAGHATVTSALPSPPGLFGNAPEIIEVVLRPKTTPGLYSAEFGGTIIVEASRSPVSDAARALHALGHGDDSVVMARHHGSNVVSMRDPLWAWRSLAVREDRNGPRLVRWEPFSSRRMSPPVRLKLVP